MICHPVVAGLFYPENPEELLYSVRHYFEEVRETSPVPKAIIAPHAGYDYSGPIAASAYAALKHAPVNRIVLIGPSHRFLHEGIAVTRATAYETPLGPIPIDQSQVEKLLKFPQVKVLEQAFREQENSIETQMPFLQVALQDFQLIPLLIGDATEEQMAEVIEALWNGPYTVIVVSSDLSHYQEYETAKHMDKQTAEAILKLSPRSIGHDRACGGIGVRALLQVVLAKKNLKAYLMDLRNSGDTAGSRDQVVGYGAFHFREEDGCIR